MVTARAQTSSNHTNDRVRKIQSQKRTLSIFARSQAALRIVLPALTFLLLAALAPSSSAQGFGNGKKHVTLHRRLPAAVHLPGKAFDVRVTAHDASYSDVAQTLSDLIPTELEKNDKDLHEDKNTPDAVISCVVTAFETPPAQTFTRNEVVVQKGKSPTQPKQFYKITGSLSVAYKTLKGKSEVIDSQALTGTYSQDFESGTNTAADESVGSKMVDPFKRLAGKKGPETVTAPTPAQLRQILIRQVVSQVAARVVNTDELIDVRLARGKLDEAGKIAEHGLWSRYLETLEQMTPFTDPAEDAYRLYAIGVGYEAEAYAEENHAAAKKLLEQAAINYGKAIDAKPSEKYFLDPQSRIEVAVAHYRQLEAPPPAVAAAPPPAPAAVPSDPATAPAKKSTATPRTTAKSSSPASTKPGSTTKPSTTPSANPTKSATSSAPAKPALTNADVIKMAKAGVDEETIVNAIHDARSVDFDLSPDGLVQLAQNNVKGKIVSAMRTKQQAAHK